MTATGARSTSQIASTRRSRLATRRAWSGAALLDWHLSLSRRRLAASSADVAPTVRGRHARCRSSCAIADQLPSPRSNADALLQIALRVHAVSVSRGTTLGTRSRWRPDVVACSKAPMTKRSLEVRPAVTFEPRHVSEPKLNVADGPMPRCSTTIDARRLLSDAASGADAEGGAVAWDGFDGCRSDHAVAPRRASALGEQQRAVAHGAARGGSLRGEGRSPPQAGGRTHEARDGAGRRARRCWCCRCRGGGCRVWQRRQGRHDQDAAHVARHGPGRRQGPHDLPVREGQDARSRRARARAPSNWPPVTTSGAPKAGRRRRLRQARHDQALGRHDAGHLQRPPAVPVRRRPEQARLAPRARASRRSAPSGTSSGPTARRSRSTASDTLSSRALRALTDGEVGSRTSYFQ